MYASHPFGQLLAAGTRPSLAARLAVDWNLSEAAWDEALAACADATYFHTSAWLRTVRATFNSRAERVRFVLPDGHFALLPLSIRPLLKGLLPLACAGETGAFSGLTASRPLTEAEAEAIYTRVRDRHPLFQVMGNPLAASAHLPALPTEEQSTHLLTLAPLPELRKGFSRGAKSRGNKARKQGFTLQIANDEASVSAFYRLYLDSVVRWGDKLTWARPESFVQALVKDAGHQAQVFLALQDGEAVSALVFVAHGRAAHYVLGATHADHLDGCPSNFLMEEAMAYYHAAGVEIFDFGASGGLAGVKQFKESFGATEVPFASCSTRTFLGDLYFAARRRAERLKSAA